MRTLGIDIGGTRIKYGVANDGDLLATGSMPTPAGGYPQVLEALKGISLEMLAAYPEVGHIGLAVPGVIDSARGIVRYSNNLGWREANICADLEAASGLPARAANDAQCAALGEALYGAGRNYDRVAMFTVGTGVGGGFIRGRKPETDLHAGMGYIFGHSVIVQNGRPCNCGRKGCLECYASAPALLRESREAGLAYGSVEALFEAARAGSAVPRTIVDTFIRRLGTGMADIGNILRPQIILLGGGVSASADLLLPGLESILRTEVYGYDYAPVRVAAAALGNTAGIIGATAL